MITVIEDVILYPGEEISSGYLCHLYCDSCDGNYCQARLNLDCTLRGSSEDKEELDSAKMFEEMWDSSIACTGILLRLGIIGRCHIRDI